MTSFSAMELAPPILKALEDNRTDEWARTELWPLFFSAPSPCLRQAGAQGESLGTGPAPLGTTALFPNISHYLKLLEPSQPPQERR